MTISDTFTHAIVFVGAPYGDNECGHIHSTHKSFATAERRFDKDFSGRTGVYNNIIVDLDKPIHGRTGEMTAREYFS